MTNWKSHAVLLLFDVLAVIAAIYSAFSLIDIWNDVLEGKQGIRQDTSIGFGFIGLVVISVHLLAVCRKKICIADRKLNILSVALLILLIFVAFATNYIVANHLRENSYVICGYTETGSRAKYPYWMTIEKCDSNVEK